jgi:hypothetical protein
VLEIRRSRDARRDDLPPARRHNDAAERSFLGEQVNECANARV